CQQEGTWPTF
nr:immunoglobulin light chain junction region [Macaca mulatta]